MCAFMCIFMCFFLCVLRVRFHKINKERIVYRQTPAEIHMTPTDN